MALDLRASGMSLVKIGEELGIDRETAADLIEKGLHRLRRGTDAKADKVRALEIHRIDLLLGSLWPRATDPKAAGEPITGEDGEIVGYGYSPAQDKAVERITKLLERRARLLGLDAPTKHEIDIGTDPRVIEFVEMTVAVLHRHPEALKDWIVAAKALRSGGGTAQVIEAKAEPAMLPEHEKESP
jgi:hypothetical protein